jgi:hypothetical protein
MHPTKKQMAKVIENFYRILPLTFEFGYGHLNFGETRVNGDCNNHECGTVHCVGGWYAIAKGLHEKDVISFKEGADAMAKDLGFSDRYELIDWACTYNDDIWQSESSSIFYSSSAWNYAKSITDIIHHLEAVHYRLPK